MSIHKDVAIRAVVKRRVAAPRECVFQVWTKVEYLQHWFFPSIHGQALPQAEVDPQVGGRYRITMHAPDGDIIAMVGGTYRTVQPPEKLVFSWTWEALQAETGETLMTMELREVQGETEIIITHERFPSPTGQEGHTIGWNCCLERLTWLIEGRAVRHVSSRSGDPCHR